jgi:DNA-binding LytR/AlgR family response regulator
MDTRFCPCNRSLAINLNQVRKVFNGRIFMNEIGEIDVSRATYFLIKKALNNYEIKDD